MITRGCLILSLIAASVFASDLEDELWGAARKGDLAAVKAAIEKGVPVDAKTRHGVTALFYAAQNGHVDVVRFLASKGADLNVKDSFYGMGVLDRAASQKQNDVVKVLLELGSKDVDSVLKSSSRGGNTAVVQIVLDSKKASPESLTQAMQLASSMKKTEVVELLKKAGVAEPPPVKIIELDAAALAKFTGKYKSNMAGEVTLSVVDGKLQLTGAGPSPLILEATGPVNFQVKGMAGVTFKFEMKDDKPVFIDLDQFGQKVKLDRVEGQ